LQQLPLLLKVKDEPMPRANWKKILLYGGMTLIALLALFLAKIAATQANWALHDPNSFSPGGYRALNLLLAANRYRLVKIADFRADLRRPLIIFTANPLPAGVRRRIFKWVAAGGTLIELAQTRPQFTAQPFQILTKGAGQTLPAQGAPLLMGLTYTVKGDPLYGLKRPAKGFVALNDVWLASLEPHGRGTTLVWCDPNGLANRSLITAPDNGVIFGLVLKSTVPAGALPYLDWRYLPQNSGRGDAAWRNIFNRYGLVLLLVVAGIGLTLWKLAARFGRPRPLALSRGRSYNEFVTSLAQLFQRARAETFVLENLWYAVTTLCGEITGLPADTPLAALLARVQAVTGYRYPDLPQIYRMVTGSAPRRPKTFLTTAARLDTIRKELQQWKSSTNN
jgi:hypothetical protein